MSRRRKNNTVGAAVDSARAGLRSQVAELDLPSRVADVQSRVADLDLPGRVAQLDLPGRVADVQSKVAELDLPGRVADLDLAGKVTDARRELAARIDPDAPKPRLRRRLLWIGLFLGLAGAVGWALRSRREDDTFYPGEPVSEPPVPQAAPSVTTTSNGSTPSPSTPSGTKN